MAPTPTALKVCARCSPLGIDNARPDFSWKLVSTSLEGVSTVQTAYAIELSASPAFEDAVWSSGKVLSDEQFGVVLSDCALGSGRRYYWRVRSWTSYSEASQWSNSAWFETAALDSTFWTAKWISSPYTDKDDRKPMYLRSQLDLPAPAVKARAYVSALGWYRLFVNEVNVTGNALVPRWTPLDHIVEYQTYDVSELFRAGLNSISIVVGDGRFRGHLGYLDNRAIYGDRLAAYVQISLELADGSRVVHCSNRDWAVYEGSIQRSDAKYGETVDLRITPNIESQTLVQVLPSSTRRLVAEEVDRVDEVQRLHPRKIWRSPSGKQLIDFGQNVAGNARVRLDGPSGQKVLLTFSEIIGQDGELDLQYVHIHEYLPQRDEVILPGAPIEFQSWFTIRGFRYVEIDGLQDTLKESDIEAIVISTKLDCAGSFKCSDTRLEQLHENVKWGVRGNFMDVPTDCPTRERTGWTGDIQVFSPTATLFVDIKAYMRRYLSNLAIEQYPNGCIPNYIPSEMSSFSGGSKQAKQILSTSVGWGDAAVMIPWTMYQYYGDEIVLERQYDSMRLWVDHMEHDASMKGPLATAHVKAFAAQFGKTYPPLAKVFNAIAESYREPDSSNSIGEVEKYILDNGFHWGEWLRPGESFEGLGDVFKRAISPAAVVATAYYANSSRLLSQVAAVLGKEDESKHYAEQSAKVASAWRTKFVRQNGKRIGDDMQDDYVRALSFELLLPEQRQGALNRLVELIEQADFHLGTGFLSTPMLLPVLASNGRSDIAFSLFFQDTSPSWLYQIDRGATTVWETWEGYHENGDAKASHNHYSFGAVVSWLREGVAGLSPAAPGYRKIRVDPTLGGGLTYASSEVETPFGLARSSWKLVSDGEVELDVIVPPGTTAIVHHGKDVSDNVPAGKHKFAWSLRKDSPSFESGSSKIARPSL